MIFMMKVSLARLNTDTAEDFTIMKFVPKLREVMGSSAPGGLTNMRINRIAPRKTVQKHIAN